MRPSYLDEVGEIVKDMDFGEVPGLDGFIIDFFQDSCAILGRDIREVVEDSQCSKSILKVLNSTFITLIPKLKGDNSTDNVFHISLINAIYKIVSKLITYMLNPILPIIIFQEKGGFVEGRKIMDGIVVDHETLNSLNVLKNVWMLIKLDMFKTYDCMNWNFVRHMFLIFLLRMEWVECILNLFLTAFFSILVNYSPYKTFNPSRGLRQGDPLSLFVYIILAEGHRRSITQAKWKWEIKGISLHYVEEGAISHL